MLEGLSLDLLTNLGSTGMLAVVVWMIFTGRLVTRREADHLIEERNYWRDAFVEEQKNTQALMETGRVAQDVLRALPVPQQGEAHDG